MSGRSGASLPDWPRLMSVEQAAAYMGGLSTNTFRALGICPLNIGKRVFWDRRSLDLYADQLAGQPLTTDDEARGMADEERAFRARREQRRNG